MMLRALPLVRAPAFLSGQVASLAHPLELGTIAHPLSQPVRHASVGPPIVPPAKPPSDMSSPKKRRTPLSVKAALRRAPFILFAKEVPTTLPSYEPAKDFQYYFANDMFAVWSGFAPAELTSGRNATSAFPKNCQRLFEGDVEVAINHAFPRIKTSIEPWQPQVMDSFLNMRKTLVNHGHMRWLLGCGAPFDDLEIGVASFRASRLPPCFDPLEKVSDEFYDIAWTELPQACFELANDESPFVLAANEYAHALQHESEIDMANWSRDHGCPWDDDKSCTADMGDAPLTKLIMGCLAKVRENPHAECWQFGSVRLGDQLMRVWVWRPLITEPTLAFSLRPHLETLPDEIKQRLLISRNELPELKAKPTMPTRGGGP